MDDSFTDVSSGVEGELWTRAPAQMRQYFRNPEQTAKRLQDGWLANRGSSGAGHDRTPSCRRPRRGAHQPGWLQVYPVEIETVLEDDPQVREAAVIAVPHEVLGQDDVAFIVPAGGETIDPDEVRARCKTRAAPNKVPSQIVIMDALPRSAYGKVVRRDLAREYERRRAVD